MAAIEVREYVTATGEAPFSQWLNKLTDVHARARIRMRLERVRRGNFGDAESVGAGVSELRIDYGPGYRIYHAGQGKTVVVLLCGGDKRTQTKDINRAQAYWADYRRRMR